MEVRRQLTPGLSFLHLGQDHWAWLQEPLPAEPAYTHIKLFHTPSFSQHNLPAPSWCLPTQVLPDSSSLADWTKSGDFPLNTPASVQSLSPACEVGNETRTGRSKTEAATRKPQSWTGPEGHGRFSRPQGREGSRQSQWGVEVGGPTGSNSSDSQLLPRATLQHQAPACPSRNSWTSVWFLPHRMHPLTNSLQVGGGHHANRREEGKRPSQHVNKQKSVFLSNHSRKIFRGNTKLFLGYKAPTHNNKQGPHLTKKLYKDANVLPPTEARDGDYC